MPQLSTSTVDADTPMGNTTSTTTSTTKAEDNQKWTENTANTQEPTPASSPSTSSVVKKGSHNNNPAAAAVAAAAAVGGSTPHHNHNATTSPAQPPPDSNNGGAASITQPPTVPTKRHRVRSRSMPNLMFNDNASKVHKPMKRHEFLNPKYLSTSNLPNCSSTTSASDSPSNNSISPLQPTQDPSSSTDKTPSKRSSHHHHHHHHRKIKRSSNGSSSIPPSASCPNAPIQAPPVNSHSLREIDLQEIFKNPQLRHDIIFDPQLQFRPNLDGERGKRKRMIAERYWDSIVNEFQDLAEVSTGSATLSPNSKLPILFHTLRDILLSLLPVKDRSYVDSILDPDLLIQQIQHCALDFLGLAKWLAGVFKAHCAPMRDAWVDQMVSRIELGIQSKSPRRLVEGLRMVFAILEAMKLDVANHQIRTLRPMLVDTAIEFEQDYYTQIIEKGKTSLNDSLEWFKNGIGKFKQSGLAEGSDANRSAFVFTLLKLFSCSSDEIVTEFPSTFGFDFSRLAGFRAELRKVVCLHLCVCLYQQMINAEANKSAQNKITANEALSSAKIEKFKQDLLAIIEDSMGNSKWTKNTHVLALEISKRVDLAFGRKLSTPSTSLLDICSGWLSKHLQPRSELYKLLENKTIIGLFQALTKCVSVLSPLDSTTTCSSTITQLPNSPVGKEIIALADRILVLVRFHWGVFGKFYVAYVSPSNNDDENSVETALGVLPPNSSSALTLQQLKESKREVAQLRQSSTSSSTC